MGRALGHLAHHMRYFTAPFLPIRRPMACSLAPVGRTWCNLACPGCYARSDRFKARLKKALTLDEFDLLCQHLHDDLHIDVAVLTDCEPLLDGLSRAKCEMAFEYFPVTWVVTNGTLPIPSNWPVTYFVSLDGPPAVHNAYRGHRAFERLARNVRRALEEGVETIYAVCTLSRANWHHIAETAKVAYELGFPGIAFDFLTPFSYDDPYYLRYPERNRAIDEILALREKYAEEGFVIAPSRASLELMRGPEWTRHCPNHLVLCVDAWGKPKERCVFGPKAICEYCGCHVYTELTVAFRMKQPLRSFLYLVGIMHAKHHHNPDILPFVPRLGKAPLWLRKLAVKLT